MYGQVNMCCLQNPSYIQAKLIYHRGYFWTGNTIFAGKFYEWALVHVHKLHCYKEGLDISQIAY